ncbi:hypothetical protein BC834DRAFT_622131 [Gloeopeniophorella convolvens]|nr:hypothetical protein BC834DRAFT_622131 [Gloeopeniophorella convolvens]
MHSNTRAGESAKSIVAGIHAQSLGNQHSWLRAKLAQHLRMCCCILALSPLYGYTLGRSADVSAEHMLQLRSREAAIAHTCRIGIQYMIFLTAYIPFPSKWAAANIVKGTHGDADTVPRFEGAGCCGIIWVDKTWNMRQMRKIGPPDSDPGIGSRRQMEDPAEQGLT